MTILVPETQPRQQFTVNIPNLPNNDSLYFELTSQYSHKEVEFIDNPYVTVIATNNRYSTLEVEFPAGFGNAHKSGIYNWRLLQIRTTLEAGLVKIVCDPGGGLGIKEFVSTLQTEERVSEVFYRPNY